MTSENDTYLDSANRRVEPCAGCGHGAAVHYRGECTAPSDPGVLCSTRTSRCPCIGYHTRIQHPFLPVDRHPDDDECTHRDDGTDATYCGMPEAAHEDCHAAP